MRRWLACALAAGPGLGCHRECSGGPVNLGVGGAVLESWGSREEEWVGFGVRRFCGDGRTRTLTTVIVPG